jgi:tail-anchored protein insertion receptor
MNSRNGQSYAEEWIKASQTLRESVSTIRRRCVGSEQANHPPLSDKQLGSARSSVSMIFKAFMFVLSTGVPFIITTYHRRSPIFYLPPGDWLGPLSSLLAMPSAPAGAVSATVWSMACKRVIALFEARFKDAFGASVPAKDGSAAAKEAAEGVEMKFAKDAKKEGTEGVKPSSEKGSTATDAASSARRRTTAKAGGGVGE